MWGEILGVPAAVPIVDRTTALLLASGGGGELTSVQVEETARELLRTTDGALQYLLVFLLAATPLLEILVVIPIGVAFGLHPIAVAIAAFFGNVLPIYALVLGYDYVASIVRSRRSRSSRSKRRERAERIWNRYGLPGLAICSPIVTGVHLGALIALGLGATRRSTLFWMTGSIVIWTVVITLLAVTGASFLSGFP